MKAIMTMTIIRIEIAIIITPMQEMHSALLRAKNIILKKSTIMQEIHSALVGKRPCEDISLLCSSIW